MNKILFKDQGMLQHRTDPALLGVVLCLEKEISERLKEVRFLVKAKDSAEKMLEDRPISKSEAA